MAKAVPLPGVQPQLLRWARESVHLSIEEVAARLKKTPEEVKDWESGMDSPTYAQLEKLAYELYKRPLALFFLPNPPAEPKPEAEFRSLPDSDLRHLSRDTILLIRRARDYQASLIELFAGRSPASDPIWKRVKLDLAKPIIPQAAEIRAALSVPFPGSREWGAPEGDEALKRWRKAVETGGVFVFKDSFKQREISGFCLDHPELPIVMLNNSTTKTRQIFSLIHELCHVLLHWRAISVFDDRKLSALPPAERKVEQFCNKVSAEVLVPSADFVSQIARFPREIEGLPEDIFPILAARYRVSREVILRKFRDDNMVSRAFYEARKAEWDAQRIEAGGDQGNYYLTKGSYLSERLMREVFSRYGRRQITVDEAADFIGVKPKHVEEFESRFLRGLAA